MFSFIHENKQNKIKEIKDERNERNLNIKSIIRNFHTRPWNSIFISVYWDSTTVSTDSQYVRQCGYNPTEHQYLDLASQNVLKSDRKKFQICPICANSGITVLKSDFPFIGLSQQQQNISLMTWLP